MKISNRVKPILESGVPISPIESLSKPHICLTEINFSRISCLQLSTRSPAFIKTTSFSLIEWSNPYFFLIFLLKKYFNHRPRARKYHDNNHDFRRLTRPKCTQKKRKNRQKLKNFKFAKL